MKYKVGDKVRIKSKDWYEKNRNFGRYIGLPLDDFNYLMAKHCGEIATITEILEDSVYKIGIDKDNFNWTDKMFEEDFDFKQLKVGETFSINGKTYLVEEKTGCPKCAFFGNSCGNVSLPDCSLMIREDGKNVIFTEIKKQLCDMDAVVNIIAPKHGFVTTKSGDLYPVCESLLTASSVVFDAVYVAGGDSIATLSSNADALHFVAEAFKHCKPIGADADAAELLIKAIPQVELPTAGVVTDGNLDDFVIALQKHRFWEREEEPKVPA